MKVVRQGFPLYVEYSLTELGKSILPILFQMNEWGLKNKEFIKEKYATIETEQN